MSWGDIALRSVPLILCGVFYAVLCVFSLVTGAIYMSGRRELSLIELPDSFAARLSDPIKRAAFARRMGLLTFVVGIVQGMTAWAILLGSRPVHYWLALGFTLFSLASVCFKLKGKIHAFPLMKLVFYLAILVVLLLGSTRAVFF